RLGLDRVEPAVAPWVAPQEPPGRQHESPQDSVGADRLGGVLGAAWMVLAAAWQGGRDEPLVEADGCDEDGSHFFGPAFTSSSSSSDLTPARPSRSAKSAASERATTTKS